MIKATSFAFPLYEKRIGISLQQYMKKFFQYGDKWLQGFLQRTRHSYGLETAYPYPLRIATGMGTCVLDEIDSPSARDAFVRRYIGFQSKPELLV